MLPDVDTFAFQSTSFVIEYSLFRQGATCAMTPFEEIQRKCEMVKSARLAFTVGNTKCIPMRRRHAVGASKRVVGTAISLL